MAAGDGQGAGSTCDPASTPELFAGDRASWQGVTVVLVGRLASMSRDEARQRLEQAGALVRDEVSVETDVVLVGQGAPPLGRDGRPARSLRTAQELLGEQGDRPRILREEEWLRGQTRLPGAAPGAPGLERLYTTEQLARILSLPASRLRRWVRLGLLRPARRVRRLAFFDFREVASARTLEQLTEQGVRTADIRRGLEELAAWLPGTEATLAQLQQLEGGTVGVRLEDGRVAEPNGQLRLGFVAGREQDAGQPAPGDEPPTLEQAVAREARTEAWFERGLGAEEDGAYEEALEAYEHVLELAGPDPDLCFNMGNVCFALGRGGDAAHHFLLAAELDREFVEAWNNLGNVLADLGKREGAERAFRCALEVAPEYADAHYNLAEILAAQDRLEEASEHWRAYLRQDPFSRWARRVRDRLEALGAGGRP